MPLIRVRDVRRSFAAGDHVVDAVRGVSFETEAGSRLAILGRSGSGKSTLLHMLAGLDRPTSGSVSVDGRDVWQLTSHELATYRSEAVGIVFQSFHLIPGRTAYQNVEMPLLLAGWPTRRRRDAVDEVLLAVGLRDRANHRPSQLSGGEQQRVAIARALVARPQLLLADEPTGNLDSQTASEIEELLLTEVRERDLTVLLVTHDQALADRFASATLTMQDGQLVSADCTSPLSLP